MPDGSRQKIPGLKERLFSRGYEFDFFQLMHLLENWQADHARIGGSASPSHEKIFLRPNESLNFPPADIQKIDPPSNTQEKIAVSVNFMGLYGVSAPTPVYLTELIGFGGEEATPLVDFLDIFNHRLISLFYRAWLKYRFPYRYESGARDTLSGCILAFVGLKELDVRPLTELPVQRLLKYVGLLAPQSRSPVNLELLLRDYFDRLPVRVREFVHRWVKIPPDQINALGALNSSLGRDLYLGSRVPDRDGKIRIEIGPIGYDEYMNFLPESRRFHDLCAFVRLWSFERFDFDIRIEIRHEEIPPAGLSSEAPVQLGRNGWISSPETGLAENPQVLFPRLQLTT